MANLGVTFDASRVQPYEAGLPVWEGRVPMTIMRTEIKATAANDGNNMLLLHVKAIDAPYIGGENVIRLNLYNRNAQAVDIAQRQLSSICHVIGKMTVTDSDQLIGVPFIGKWEKESREVQDQTTGAKRTLEGCQCRDFAFIDGRTIKEAMAGQPASSPYIPGQSGIQEAAARGSGGAGGQAQPAAAPIAQLSQPAQPAAFGGMAAPTSGFQPPTPQPGGSAPQAAFAGTSGPVPGQTGAQPGQTGQGFGTAASGFSPPSPQQGGFTPPAAQPQQQGGFSPPAGPQPGSGPWGGAPAQGGGFGPR